MRELIWSILQASGRGLANVISMDTLAAQAGVTTRQLQEEIHDMRLAGYPIASLSRKDRHGFYIPGSVAESLAYRSNMVGRIRNTRLALDAVDASLVKLYGAQMELALKAEDAA